MPSRRMTPAAMLAYGSGGYRFYSGTSTFSSPTGDNGTLTTGGGLFTYTSANNQKLSFNSSGLMTAWTSADGSESLSYAYDGSSRLATITAIDGAVSTIGYNAGNVVIRTVNSPR